MRAEAVTLNGRRDGKITTIPVTTRMSGLLVAEGVVPHENGTHLNLEGLANIPTRRTIEGLHIPEKPKAGPFDFVQLTDFGGESTKTDLADLEVELNLRSIANRNGVEIGAITQGHLEGFSTANTGFATAQLTRTKDSGDIERVFYINCNPRLDPDDKRSWTDEDNFGRFVYVRLKDGTKIFTVNSKYALSFIKDEIEEGYVLNTKDNHQFLSRREFIIPTMAVLAGDTSYFEGELDVDAIADPPEGDWIAKDGNGNIKTSWKIGHLLEQPGIEDSPYLSVTIGDETHIVKNDLISGRHHNITTGDLVLRGGSSGYRDWEPPTPDQFVEVQKMFGSALDAFKLDVVTDGKRVTIEPAIDVVFAETRELAGANL